MQSKLMKTELQGYCKGKQQTTEIKATSEN
jgi:hypothetical protein